jgi:hypothetical protein
VVANLALSLAGQSEECDAGSLRRAPIQTPRFEIDIFNPFVDVFVYFS